MKFFAAVCLAWAIVMGVVFYAANTINEAKKTEAETAYAESVDDSFGEYWYGFDGGHVEYYRLNSGQYRVDVYKLKEVEKSGKDELVSELESTVLVDDVDTADDIVDMILENNR